MPEEVKGPELTDGEKKTYLPPILVQYGTIVELTGGKTVTGTDLLAGGRR